MTNNGLRTFNDIMDYLSYLEKKYGKIEKELKEMKIGFFSSDKKKLKNRKSKMEEELERITDIYEYYDNFFRTSTTFSRKDLSLFLSRYFALVYGKAYEVQHGVYDVSDGKYAKTCDFIASSSDFDRIDKKYDLNKRVNLDQVMELCKDDCISLGGTKSHTLLADSELNSDFGAFPEIIEAAKKLINVKLSHPDLSDKERLEYVLKDMATDIELKRQEELLGASVCSTTSQDQPKINIIGRSDQPTQTTGAPIPGMTSTEIKSSSTALDGDKAMQDAIARALQSIQANQGFSQPVHVQTFTQPEQTEDTSVVLEPKKTSTEEKKLTKSMMGIYMNRN